MTKTYSFSKAYESYFSVMVICNCNKKQKSYYSRIRSCIWSHAYPSVRYTLRQFGFCWIGNTRGIRLDVRATEIVVLHVLPVNFVHICQKECEYWSMSVITREAIKEHTDIYRVIRNDCRGFNNFSYTMYLRYEYVVAPMDHAVFSTHYSLLILSFTIVWVTDIVVK
jgi:hypothetical protein